MKTILAIICLTLLPIQALALTTEAPATVNRFAAVVALNNVALNVTSTSDAVDVRTWSHVKIQLIHTNDSASAIEVYFEESDDGVTWSKITKTSGTDATTVFSPDIAVAASGNFTMVLNVMSFEYIRIVSSSTSGAAADKLTCNMRQTRGI